MAVFFVGGSARAGTTLMQAVLCADARATPVMAESTNLSALINAYLQGLSQFDKSVGDFFPDRNALREFYADAVARYTTAVAKRTGAEHLVFKDPNLTPHFVRVLDLVPDARFVVIVRHPLDVVASMVRVSQRLERMGEWSPFEHADTKRMCGQYLGCYSPLAEAEQAGETFRRALFVVRYEDLVLDPAPALAAVSAFTGLACSGFDVGGEWRMFSRRAFAGNKRQEAFPTKLSGRGIAKDSVGAFRDVLSKDACRTVRECCADAIQAFGYQGMTVFESDSS